MNKNEFFDAVKAAGIEADAVDSGSILLDEEGEVEFATVYVENSADLPPEVARDGYGSGAFYSEVNYTDGYWVARAGYSWSDSMTSYGSMIGPGREPGPGGSEDYEFESLAEAASQAVDDAEGMAEALQYNVFEKLALEGGPVEGYEPAGWQFGARFDLTPVTE